MGGQKPLKVDEGQVQRFQKGDQVPEEHLNLEYLQHLIKLLVIELRDHEIEIYNEELLNLLNQT